MNKPTAAIITLGCKVNQYESEAVAERLTSLGFDVLDPSEPCDIYIINSCTVTAEADRKSRQAIRRARKGNINASVIVAGCFAENDPTAAAKIEGVAYVIGNKNKLFAADAALLTVKNGRPATPEILTGGNIFDETEIEKMSITHAPRTRAYIKICDGCDGKCAYCIIPSVRGRVRSRSISDICDEAAALVASGCREIVLTGIETAAFGRDTKETLAGLIKALAEINGIDRIRMGSLEPTVMRPEFIETLAQTPKAVPHFHLSLQSGCTRTLGAMRRKYTVEAAMQKLEALRAAIPDVMFTTDVIVGFPGETDADFEETLDFVRRARFLDMHVFQYSKRRGTPAATMPDQIPEAVKHERSSRLIALSESIKNDVIRDFVARTPECDVLFESDINGLHSGHTSNFIEVRTPVSGVTPGEIRKVRFTDVKDGIAYGTLAEE